MKKLFLTLGALIVALFTLNVSAQTIYVMGSGEGLSWENFPGKAIEPSTDGSYTFTIANLTGFKMSTVAATGWDGDGGFNSGAFGYSGTFGDAVFNAAGQTVALEPWGENQDMPYPGSYTININAARTSMTVKANFTKPTAAPDVYIRGGMNNWGSSDAYKFTNKSWDGTSGQWTWTGTIAAGMEFKIADANWGNINYSTNSTITQFGTPLSLSYNQQNSKMAETFTGTITLNVSNYSGHQATATFTPNGMTPTYPETMYVLGNVNGKDWAPDNGVVMTKIGEGKFEVKNLQIGNAGDGTAYFSFTEALSSNWDDLGIRYGATENDFPAGADGSYTLAYGSNAFKVDGDITFDIVLDLKDMTITISNYPGDVVNPDGPAYISVAFGSNGMFNFPVQNEDDVKLYPSAATPGIYEGVIPFKRGVAFAFYTDENVAYTGTAGGQYLGISLSRTYWPISDPDNDADDMIGNHLLANNNIRMYVSSFTSGYPSTTASVKVIVDWTNQTFSLELMPYDYKAPEELYVWGTEMGFYGSGYKNMATMKPISTGSHIYECTLNVPECGPFEPDGEFAPMEGDPDYGFYFYLTDSATSKGGTGVISYLAPAESHLIEIPEAGNSFSTQLLYNNTGVTMVALSPGNVRMNYDYDRNIFTMTMLTPEGEVATSSVTFRFTGIENASQYVSIFDTVNEEAVETSSSFTYEFAEYAALSIAMTEENVAEGYSFTISSNGEQSGETYTLTGMGMDDSIQYMLGLYPGADGYVFTINVTKEDVEPEPEPNVVTFRFEGVENAYSYVSIFDMNNGTSLETSNSFTYEYTDSAALSIAMTEENVAEGYSFTISCNGEQSGETYTLTGMGMDDAIQYMLALYPGADGYVFTITVSKTIVEPEPEPKTVYFAFTGIEKGYEYVTIFDTATGSVLDAAASVSYQYANTASLSIAMSEENVEAGYAFTVSCKNPQSADTYTLSGIDMDDAIQYMLALYPGADNYIFTIDVTYNPADSGIMNLFVDGENITVYNINGMVVVRNAAAADLKALAPGLYIVNGKKLVVK